MSLPEHIRELAREDARNAPPVPPHLAEHLYRLLRDAMTRPPGVDAARPPSGGPGGASHGASEGDQGTAARGASGRAQTPCEAPETPSGTTAPVVHDEAEGTS